MRRGDQRHDDVQRRRLRLQLQHELRELRRQRGQRLRGQHLTSTAHRGGCNRPCTGTCTGGVCTPACSAGANLATSATPTCSSGGVNETGYGPNNLNNNVLQGSGTSCGYWSWVSADSTPGSAWFQYTWNTDQRIHSMFVDTSASGQTCSSPSTSIGRNLAGTDIQYWNGSAWVTVAQIRGQTNDWSYTFATPITTRQLRLYAAHTNTVGQGTNPKIFEWRVFGCQ
ncbi:MAG: hypothetical protein U0325_36370 [Polyangiales bacterium]